jgi:Peptidase family S51
VRVILLGPQRRPTVDAVVRSLVADGSLAADGTVATVTAGWLEREPDDRELSALLEGRDVNLGLYGRWLDVQERDPGYAAGERRRQEVLADLQDSYLLRLDYALQAVYALQRRAAAGAGQRRGGFVDGPVAGRVASAGGAPVADAVAGAVAGAAGAPVADAVAEACGAVRELDAAHLRHVEEARDEFSARLRPDDRPVIAEHRAAVADLLASAAALVLAGGHVGVLADLLHLFDPFNLAAAPRSPVIAWSAGAMALTDRIVLFHDRSPQGPGHPEVYGSGLGMLRDAVLLPHARARLLLDDTPRMAVFARRFAPARCILLENGTRIEIVDDGATVFRGARILAEDGHVTTVRGAA